jgi:hypothetical protein
MANKKPLVNNGNGNPIELQSADKIAVADLEAVASTIVGNKATGGTVSLTPAEVRTLINVADGATANSITHAKLTSNFTTTSGSAVDVTGMTLAVSANKIYRLSISFAGAGSTGNRLMVKLAVPSGTNTGGAVAGSGFFYNAGTDNFVPSSSIIAYSTTSPKLITGYVDGTLLFIAEIIVVVSSTAGNVTLQVYNNENGGSAVTVYAGTNMVLTEVS